ncbi:mariner Mos1 transposase [Trichonephila clavipes]|nr:mariner Mos1 transposase [Trichonephila clavipes]
MKSAAEAHSILVETYADNALSETTCIEWFRRFKINDFEEDKEYSGTSKKFEEKELEELLDQDPCQTLAATISKRRKALSVIQDVSVEAERCGT